MRQAAIRYIPGSAFVQITSSTAVQVASMKELLSEKAKNRRIVETRPLSRAQYRNQDYYVSDLLTCFQ